jgi:hypothetical protein
VLAHIPPNLVFQRLAFIFNRDDSFAEGKVFLELQIVNNLFVPRSRLEICFLDQIFFIDVGSVSMKLNPNHVFYIP